jgi:hypothetical protein
MLVSKVPHLESKVYVHYSCQQAYPCLHAVPDTEIVWDWSKPRILFRLSNFCLRSCMSVSFTCTVVLLAYIPAFFMALHEGTGMPANKFYKEHGQNELLCNWITNNCEKWGLSWCLGLKCDNCNFCGEKTKVYTVSDTDAKKGQKWTAYCQYYPQNL